MSKREKHPQASILLVDDREDNLNVLESLLRRLLADPQIDIVKVTSGNDALGQMLETEFALVLLDVQMPEMDGFEIAQLMKSSERTKNIPIIFVTAISKDFDYLIKGYKTGAVDYLFKPISPEILKSKVSVFLELYRQKKSIQATGEALQMTVEELKKANQKILDQQKVMIEEERLKVLLQMAGATAHELNQPLTYMLNHISLIDIDGKSDAELGTNLAKIKDAGHRIAKVIKKMQSIRHERSILPSSKTGSVPPIEQQIRILSIEDSDDDFGAIHSCLKDQEKISVVRARSLAEGVEQLEDTDFDLIFLDYVLPDGNGLNFLHTMEVNEYDVPVVVITGQGDEMIASQIIQAGVYDYLPKDRIGQESITRIIVNTLEKVRLRKEVELAHKKLSEMSVRDELTKLYNRRYFQEALSRAMSQSERHKTDLTLCMADLDHFKNINDTYGHPAGDMVLHEIGKILADCFRHYDLLCRYGGEELAIILPNTDPQGALAVCERFRTRVAERLFKFNNREFQLTVSIGIAWYDGNSPMSPEELVTMADTALYSAKRAGRDQAVLYPVLGSQAVSTFNPKSAAIEGGDHAE